MQATFHPQRQNTTERDERRSFRYALKDMAGRILANTQKRVARCGHTLVGPQAVVCVGDRGGYVAGTETCGSVWACPVCAAKIGEKRRGYVAKALDGHVEAGGAVFMGLFTIPHHAAESCAALRDIVAGSWRRAIQGKAWKSARKEWGIIGYIRALEVTFGKNGWHPHLHVLFLTRELSQAEEGEFRVWLAERWADAVLKFSKSKDARHLKTVNTEVGFGLQRAASKSAAGDYVAKWGADSEIAKASSKVSRKGGRSPWQLLADAREGDHQARMAFREYASAMKGARHLTWSNGLFDLYVGEPELTDEEIARQDAPHNGDLQVIAFRRTVWFRLVCAGIVPEVLSAAEEAGRSGVLKLLRARGLALPEAAFVKKLSPEGSGPT